MAALAFLLGAVLASVSSAVAVKGSHPQPVIELDGPNPMKLPVSEESYSDPGAGCYDAMRKEDIGEVLDVSGDIVRLDVPGTYTIRYGCKTKTGEEATPILRHIIVSPEVKAEYWKISASTDISLPHYEAVTPSMEQKIGVSLSDDLDVPQDDISIDSITEQKMWDKSAYLTVKFTVRTTQRALTEDLEYELQDKSFGTDFDSTLRQQGLQAQHVTLGPNEIQIQPPGPPIEAKLTMAGTLALGGGALALVAVAAVFYKKYTDAKKELVEYQLASTREETSGFANSEVGATASGDGDSMPSPPEDVGDTV
eukprot:g1707.t1